MTHDIRLIAVDMDGTLLNDDKEVPAGFGGMVLRLYERGVRVVIASGRQYFNIVSMFPELADKLLFIAENGGLAFDGRKNIFANAIPRPTLRRVLSLVSNIATATPLLCGAKAAYMTDSDPVTRRNIALYYKSRRVSSTPFEDSNGDAVVKVAVFDLLPPLESCSEVVRSFSGELALTLSAQNWLDLSALGVNKGRALKFLQERLGIAPEQSMAFGDYPNDLEMLQQVKYGYAMANSHPDVLAKVRFRAPSNQDDGVMRVLAEYFGKI
ncbi:MAG: HAD family hydrolase [Victivallaceae bacterium]|nr:HAD family hydrolase [Victivallaceae bacterium]